LVNYARSTGLDNNADSQSCAASTSKMMDIDMDNDSFPRPKINSSEVVEVYVTTFFYASSIIFILLNIL